MNKLNLETFYSLRTSGNQNNHQYYLKQIINKELKFVLKFTRKKLKHLFIFILQRNNQSISKCNIIPQFES
jgi:hypothetical protein